VQPEQAETIHLNPGVVIDADCFIPYRQTQQAATINMVVESRRQGIPIDYPREGGYPVFNIQTDIAGVNSIDKATYYVGVMGGALLSTIPMIGVIPCIARPEQAVD
jgi:hypothetical protein